MSLTNEEREALQRESDEEARRGVQFMGGMIIVFIILGVLSLVFAHGQGWL